jgi:hypothetical protein
MSTKWKRTLCHNNRQMKGSNMKTRSSRKRVYFHHCFAAIYKKKCFKIKVIISKVKKLLANLLEKTRLLENLQKIDEFLRNDMKNVGKSGK